MADMIDEGRGSTLVFLHGAGVDNMLWEPQISAFARTHRVVVPNLPGHGGVPATGSVQHMAEQVRAQLLDKGINRYAVIGLSLGGMVALEMAGRWGDEITHLVMIESVPNVTDSRAMLLIARALLALFKLIPPRFLSVLPARQLGAETEDSAAYLKQTLVRMSARNNYAVLQAALAYDGRPHLAGLKMPVLVMVGEKNKGTHKRARAMAEAVAHAQFVVVPAAGHIANRDAPQFVNNVLLSFLSAAAV